MLNRIGTGSMLKFKMRQNEGNLLFLAQTLLHMFLVALLMTFLLLLMGSPVIILGLFGVNVGIAFIALVYAPIAFFFSRFRTDYSRDIMATAFSLNWFFAVIYLMICLGKVTFQ